MRLVLVGPPGSGKGTQAERLCDRLQLNYIGTGDILRDAIRLQTPIGKQVDPLMKQGLLVPDPVVNEVVAELFSGPTGRNDSSSTATPALMPRPSRSTLCTSAVPRPRCRGESDDPGRRSRPTDQWPSLLLKSVMPNLLPLGRRTAQKAGHLRQVRIEVAPSNRR